MALDVLRHQHNGSV